MIGPVDTAMLKAQSSVILGRGVAGNMDSAGNLAYRHYVGNAIFLPRCMECRRGLAMRILSVRLSVTFVNCDKTVERSVQIFIPYER